MSQGSISKEHEGKRGRRVRGEERVGRRLNWRFYSFHELKTMLQEHGLRIVASYGSLDKDEITFGTTMMRIVSEEIG